MEVQFNESPLADPQTARVFVTHYDRHQDWRDLTRFSKRPIIGMFCGKTIFPDVSEKAEARVAPSIQTTIQRNGFEWETDYVVLAGDILIQAIGISVLTRILSKVLAPHFTVLRFDKREGRYWPFKVGL